MTEDQIWELFFELHDGLVREGPGDTNSTLKAYRELTHLPIEPSVLDIGCGPGKQTLDLSTICPGKITAIDNHVPYINGLKKKIQQNHLSGRLEAMEADMFNLPFPAQSFDIIWAEGSIYNIGFEQGLRKWKPLLKHHGYIAVTEVNWLQDQIPHELNDFWQKEYPAINQIDFNLEIIENTGYKNVSHFILPAASWWDEYYKPLEINIKNKLAEYETDTEKTEILKNQQYEIDIFHRYSDYYSYVFYIMQKQEPEKD